MSLAVVTTSYRPDFASFARLHESVAKYTDPSVRHIVAVPGADVPLFESIDSSRLEVINQRQVLPRWFVETTRLARLPYLPRGFRVASINLARPWLPIRGWILQQIVKLAVVAELDVDVALILDSDVLVIRPIEESTFRRPDGVVRLYRKPNGIWAGMKRHVAERRRALELLAVGEVEAESPDYIGGIMSCDPALVREMLARIQEVTGQRWQDCVGSSLDFSEFITYGTYVMSLADESKRSFVSDDSLCLSHWDLNALDLEAARLFLAGLKSSDLAIHIQSNTGTSDAVLEFVAAQAATAD
ncbi:DUF6492 family protein [Xylanimonas sp. McL0601]|uniref:DUF6492 family protein n=1 Tax=Xylanimonas sp. McL0601 TaxID=3414739 RepID=UPI003CF3D9BF